MLIYCMIDGPWKQIKFKFDFSILYSFRFFKIPSPNVDYFADQLDCLVRPNYVSDIKQNSKKRPQSKSYRTSTGEEDSLKIIYALDELSKQIRNLQGLPLDVISIQGSQSAFRLTEVGISYLSKYIEISFRTSNLLHSFSMSVTSNEAVVDIYKLVNIRLQYILKNIHSGK